MKYKNYMSEMFGIGRPKRSLNKKTYIKKMSVLEKVQAEINNSAVRNLVDDILGEKK
jgi:hypothetical protein